MGLQGFERGLERAVDVVFSRGAKATLRPVEIGRKLLREMDDHRSVDVKGRRVVPNEYTVHLSQRDYADLSSIEEALRNELADTVRDYARSEGYHVMGPVAVYLDEDERQRPGRVTIRSAMREGAGGGGAGSLILPSGERVALDRPVITLGRLPTCDVPLVDANISRRHTEVRAAGTGFIVRDLGSTNGTMVNGIRIVGDQPLNNGDIISLAGIHLRFEAL